MKLDETRNGKNKNKIKLSFRLSVEYISMMLLKRVPHRPRLQ